jgi:hypothetical protein
MGVPTSAVGYISVAAGRGDHEVHKGHVVALARKKFNTGTWAQETDRLENLYSHGYPLITVVPNVSHTSYEA